MRINAQTAFSLEVLHMYELSVYHDINPILQSIILTATIYNLEYFTYNNAQQPNNQQHFKIFLVHLTFVINIGHAWTD